MENKVSLKKAGLYYLFGNIFNTGISFLTLPIFTRLLSPADYGIVVTYNSYVGILTMIISLTMHVGIRTSFVDYAERVDDFISVIITFNLVYGLCVSAVVSFSCIFFPNINFFIVALCLIQSLASALVSNYIMYLMMKCWYRRRTAFMALPNLLSAAISIPVIMYVTTTRPYLGKILPGVIVTVFFAGVVLYYVYRASNVFWNKEYILYAVKVSAPVVLHGMALYVLSQSDRIMITHFQNTHQTGIYGLIYSFSMIATVFTTACDGVWVPYFTRKMKETTSTSTINIDSGTINTGSTGITGMSVSSVETAESTRRAAERAYDDINRTALKYIAFMTWIMVSVVLVSPEVVKLMAARPYWEGISIIPPLVLSNYLIFVYTFYVNIEYHYKKTVFISLNTLIAAMTNIILNVFFIKAFGYVGAAYTTLFSYAVSLALHYKYARNLDKNLFPVKGFIAPLIVVGAVVCVFYLFAESPLLRWTLAITGSVAVLPMFVSAGNVRPLVRAVSVVKAVTSVMTIISAVKLRVLRVFSRVFSVSGIEGRQYTMIRFFSDEFQETLKKQVATQNNNIATLEDYICALRDYRTLFLAELDKEYKEYQQLSSSTTSPKTNAEKFNIDFITDVRNNYTTLISLCFDEIIGILKPFLYKNPLQDSNFAKKVMSSAWVSGEETALSILLPIAKMSSRDIAKIKLEDYLKKRCTGWSNARNLSVTVPLFRARKKGSYARNIHELYHVPFDKKNLLSDERFSSKVAPMLYASETIEGTLHETHLAFEEANFALFFPKYSKFYNNYFFDINNSIQADLWALMCTEKEVAVEYDNKQFTFNKENMPMYLAEFLLFQILHFPVYTHADRSEPSERREVETRPQYLIPQMIMELESAKDYFTGIIYHSASSLLTLGGSGHSVPHGKKRGMDRFGRKRDMNVCFCIPDTSETNDSTDDSSSTYELSVIYSEPYLNTDIKIVSSDDVADTSTPLITSDSRTTDAPETSSGISSGHEAHEAEIDSKLHTVSSIDDDTSNTVLNGEREEKQREEGQKEAERTEQASIYNESYLDNFFTALYFQGEETKSFEEVDALHKKALCFIKQGYAAGYMMNDYSFYLTSIESHIESMQQIDPEYTTSQCGLVEATLFVKFLEQIMPIVENPGAYDAMLRSDLQKRNAEQN